MIFPQQDSYCEEENVFMVATDNSLWGFTYKLIFYML